jgi:hypothetical protein
VASNPFDQFDTPQQAQQPMVVGTPRPKKPEVREVGGSLGVVDDSGHFTPTYTPPKDATAKDPNGTQGMAAGFYGRALYANQKYGNGVPPRDALSQGVMDMLPTGIANTFSSHDRQLSNSYAKDFVAATLRKESGAAISPEEYQNQYMRYFPMPGDTEDTMAAKARLRDTAIESLRNQAGPAAAQADQSVQSMIQADNATTTTEKGFGLKEDHSGEMTPEQQTADRAFLLANPNASPEQYNTFLTHLLGRPTDINGSAARLKGVKEGGAYTGQVTDPRVQQGIDQRLQQGGGGGAAFTAGAADTAGLGFSDEVGAGIDAFGQSLSGDGSFPDNYSVNLQANRGYQKALQEAHPLPYLGGQVVGGAALPAGEVSAPMDLAKIAAIYGGGYGVGSGTDTQSRLVGGGAGAVAGGAMGYGLGRLSGLANRKPAAVPELVDQTTGALNQPLEAMSPGQRVQAANQFGIDLPLDAAGGRTAAVIGKGLDIMPGSAGAMEDARRATEQQVAHAADVVAGKFGSSRTLNEAGSEIQRGALERNDRATGVIGRAYKAIPIPDTTPTTNANTVATLQQLTGRFQSNPELAASLKDSRLQTYLGAIQKGGLSWKDLKDFRSLIGEKIGDMRFGESHSISDLRALYAGLSEDMRNTAANQGPGALRAFERANNLNRQNEQLVQGALTRILGKDGQLAPEKAASAIQAMTKGGKSTGDIATLAKIKGATVKSGAWDEVAATLIRLGGQPANSAGRDFSPQTFVSWYADMSEAARGLLFKPELRQALDQFVAVNQRLTKVNALRNTSQTAGSMMAAGTVGVLGLASIHPGAAAALMVEMAGNYGMAKVWTNPGFVRLATGFARAQSPSAAKVQIGRMAKFAAKNPELREPIQAILRNIANDNFVGKMAASPPDANQEQNQQ